MYVPPAAPAAYDLRGSAGSFLPGGVRASANIDYPSDIAANRAYNVNLIEASRNTRQYGAKGAGVWADYAWTPTAEHRETFDDLDGKSTVTGGSPRIRVGTCIRLALPCVYTN